MSQLILFVQRSREAFTPSLGEELPDFLSDLIFGVVGVIADRFQTVLKVLAFGLSLEVKREVSKHPVEEGKILCNFIFVHLIAV